MYLKFYIENVFFFQKVSLYFYKFDELECLLKGIYYIDRYNEKECYYWKNFYDFDQCEKVFFDFKDFYLYMVVNIGLGVSILIVRGLNNYQRVSGIR